MENKKVWHNTYGEGVILEENEKHVKVKFENDEEKIITSKVWGKFLFLNKEDSDKFETPEIIEKYAALNGSKKALELEKEKKETIRKNLNNKMLIPKFEGPVVRRICLVYRKKYCMREGAKEAYYLNLMGVDLMTGILVHIVDTNGAKYNLHTYSEILDNIPMFSIFEASFKFYNDDRIINILRIVSDIEIIKTTSFKNLNKEIKAYSGRNLDFTTDFETMTDFWENRKSGEGYAIVNFTDTRIEKYKSRYQMKMGKRFVNVDHVFYKPTTKYRYYSGIALIKGFIDNKGRNCFYSHAFFNKSMSEDEHDRFLERKEKYKNQKDEFVEDEYSVFWSEFIEECKEKDETYIDYEGDIIGDYNEYETEEEPEENEVFVNDEY